MEEEDLIKATAKVTLTTLAEGYVGLTNYSEQRAVDRQTEDYITNYCRLLGLGNITEDLWKFYHAEKKRIRRQREADAMSYPIR